MILLLPPLLSSGVGWVSNSIATAPGPWWASDPTHFWLDSDLFSVLNLPLQYVDSAEGSLYLLLCGFRLEQTSFPTMNVESSPSHHNWKRLPFLPWVCFCWPDKENGWVSRRRQHMCFCHCMLHIIVRSRQQPLRFHKKSIKGLLWALDELQSSRRKNDKSSFVCKMNINGIFKDTHSFYPGWRLCLGLWASLSAAHRF